jgi:hypothetical protein
MLLIHLVFQAILLIYTRNQTSSTKTILSMGLFDFLKPKPNIGLFVVERKFIENRTNQVHMTPKTLDQLRNLEVTSDDELKMEYFFYTNTIGKAKSLADEMGKLEYTAWHGPSAADKKLFLVTGWTTKMKMTDEVVTLWAKQMCEIGYQFDCDFDGWGTSPDQE